MFHTFLEFPSLLFIPTLHIDKWIFFMRAPLDTRQWVTDLEMAQFKWWATALLIFKGGAPRFFLAYSSHEIVPYVYHESQ